MGNDNKLSSISSSSFALNGSYMGSFVYRLLAPQGALETTGNGECLL